MRISDWSSDVCSSDLTADEILRQAARLLQPVERLEGRGGDDAAEIEDNGREAHGVINIPALGSAAPDSISRYASSAATPPVRRSGWARRGATSLTSSQASSEEGRVGTEGVSTCGSRGAP